MSSPDTAPRVGVSNPKAVLETVFYDTEDAATTVLHVLWDIPQENAQEGEWMVEWDSMYADLSEDIRSARSEKGGYFALQREAGHSEAGTPVPAADEVGDMPGLHEPQVSIQEPTPTISSLEFTPRQFEPDLPTAPLSTAKLLAFENGPNLLKTNEDENLPEFFSKRPIVQAPAHIVPLVGAKTEVYFLLAPGTDVPASVRIMFIPTWSPPGTSSNVVAEANVLKQQDDAEAMNLHERWAEWRLEDLKTLQEIAKELEREGARGVGKGRVKVGVEGGGMDEEAVRREGWMVGEEMHWVRDRFLSSATVTVCSGGLEGLGITSPTGELRGMSLLTSPNPISKPKLSASTSTAPSRRTRPVSVADDEDLFALPLSPRSPDMALSPFSMFRGEPLESPKPLGSMFPPTKLRDVASIDTTASPLGIPSEVTPSSATSPGPKKDALTPIMAAGAGTNAPPTPPLDRRGTVEADENTGLFQLGVGRGSAGP